MKILVFATHPIQYQAPLYRKLAEKVDLKVIYLLKQNKEGQAKAGFGVDFEWDVPLTEGYSYQYLNNLSKHPSSSSYKGIILDEEEVDALLLQEEPYAVIINGWFPKGMKQVISCASKRKITIFCRGDSTLLMTRNPFKKMIKEVYIRSILRKIDYFLYVGKENKKYYTHYGVRQSRLFPALHCINTDFFKQQFLTHPKRVPKGVPVRIGFVGKFIAKKQPLLLLQAIKESKYKENINVLFVGDGVLRADIESYAKRNSIHIEMAGFLNQSEIVSKGYAKMDFLVLPSKFNETWGLVVNEVMTGGIPAIVSNRVGCHTDLILSGKTGYVFESDDPLDLSKKIDLLIEKLKESDNMKKDILDHINTYSMENTMEGYLKALRVS